MGENKAVFIFGETINGKLSPITTELLGCGRNLADQLEEELICLLAGDDLGDTPALAIHYGADKVFQVSDPSLKVYSGDSYVAVLEKVVNKVSPQIVLFGQTEVGRDLAPRLAFRLQVGLTMDCLGLNINPVNKKLEQEKPVYGGNARAVFVSDSFPQIATIRKKSMSPLLPDDSRKGQILSLDTDFAVPNRKSGVKIIEIVKEEKSGIKLEEANVVIAGGRGLGDPAAFEKLYEVARLLEGAVGSSKHPCDHGWISDSVQVGLTGKIVAPDVYIAVGISGASQHMAGCSGSRVIIAINKNPEANIFKFARYGIVADWKEALPAFSERIQELINSER